MADIFWWYMGSTVVPSHTEIPGRALKGSWAGGSLAMGWHQQQWQKPWEEHEKFLCSPWKMGFGSEFLTALNWLQGKDGESHQLRLWSVIQVRNRIYEMFCFVVLAKCKCIYKMKGNCCLPSLKCPSFWPSQVPHGLSAAVLGNSSGRANYLKYRNRTKLSKSFQFSANTAQSFPIWQNFCCDSCLWMPELKM